MKEKDNPRNLVVKEKDKKDNYNLEYNLCRLLIYISNHLDIMYNINTSNPNISIIFNIKDIKDLTIEIWWDYTINVKFIHPSETIIIQDNLNMTKKFRTLEKSIMKIYNHGLDQNMVQINKDEYISQFEQTISGFIKDKGLI